MNGFFDDQGFSDRDLGKFKEIFDNEIIDDYLTRFKDSLGISDDRFWLEFSSLLKKSRQTKWSLKNKLGRLGRSSNAVRKPTLDNFFRYLAATDQEVPCPRGLDVVLTSIATTLIHIRSNLPGYIDQKINKYEVEIIRYYFANINIYDDNYNLNVSIIKKMRTNIGHVFGGQSESMESINNRVKKIIITWFSSWVIFERAVPYEWTRFKIKEQ